MKNYDMTDSAKHKKITRDNLGVEWWNMIELALSMNLKEQDNLDKFISIAKPIITYADTLTNREFLAIVTEEKLKRNYDIENKNITDLKSTISNKCKDYTVSNVTVNSLMRTRVPKRSKRTDKDEQNIDYEDNQYIVVYSKTGVKIALNKYLSETEKDIALKTSTIQLFELLCIKHCEDGWKSETIVMPLSYYMEKRGITDFNTAKIQVIEDLDALRRVSLSPTDKEKKLIYKNKKQTYYFINLAQSGSYSNGIITFTLNTEIFNFLKESAKMYIPACIYKVNNNSNPNTYNLGRRIAEHVRMNYGKPNQWIISVKTLLEVCNALPKHDEIINKESKDKHVGRRIIEAFERDLNALEEAITWHYCGAKDEQLKAEELANFNYDIFIKSNIKITWIDYPETEVKNKQAKLLKSAKTKKKKQ